MINPVEKITMFVQKTLPEVFDDSLSYYEAVIRLVAKINEIGGRFNDFISDLNKKEYSDDISNKRKLSPTGNFTGTLLGRTIISVFSDINNALSLCNTLIDMVNHRESIGTIYDGGLFVETVPPTITIEGGLF